MDAEREKSISSRDKAPDKLYNLKWLALNTYTEKHSTQYAVYTYKHT